MSKKRDPIIAVLNYFETADPVLCVQALAMVKEILKKRQPSTTTRKPAATKKRLATQSEAPVN